ncbi:MAG TPA: hypothetical protein VEY95_01155, partial [Azospirillaceae bacterium]|nr:hypothetical protein [Azospirillaceae bacterium]
GRIPGFARGTPSAPPGVALVGEEGPELVMMRGGEQVFDARRTAALLAGMGRGGDTLVAHINASEARLLKRLGGSGTVNPRTGLLEFMNDADPGWGGHGSRGAEPGAGVSHGSDADIVSIVMRGRERTFGERVANFFGQGPGGVGLLSSDFANMLAGVLGTMIGGPVLGIGASTAHSLARGDTPGQALGNATVGSIGMSVASSIVDTLGKGGSLLDGVAAASGERSEGGASYTAREGGALDSAVQGVTEAYREQAQAAQAATGATKDAAKTTTDAAKAATEQAEKQKIAEEILAAARKSAGDNLDAVLKTDSLTEWEAAAEHLAGKMEGFAELFHRLGMDAKAVQDTYAEASRQLAGKFDRSVREQILAIENPAQLMFEQWSADRDQALKSARATGGNIAAVERLYGLKRQEIVKQSLATQRDALLSAYQRESAELEQTRDAFKRLAETLKDTRQGLLLDPALSPLDPGGRLEEARKQFEDIYKKAQLGDVEAGNRLPEAARTFLEASRGYNASSEAYAADFARVQSALANTETVAERHLRIAEQKLDSMRQQLSALGLLNTTVQTFGEALKQYLAAQSAAGGVNVPGGGGSGGGSSGGSSGGGHPPGTANNLAIVDDLYRNGLGWTPSGSELAYWTNHLNTGMSLDEVKRWMASSAREKGRTVGGPLTGFATGGSFTVEGASGIDALSLPQLRVTRGEIVNISRKDSMEGLATELRALRDEMRGLVRVTAASGDANVQGQKAMHEQLSDINRKARLEAAA